jgi:UDP-N-acetylglucosamine transferase subunit ALG13
MIFATVGSTDFDDLVQAIDGLAVELPERVVVQYGHGRQIPQHCEGFRFAPDLGAFLEQADVVVSHGGLCTVMEVLHRGGRLVGVANPDRFDDHQEEILGELAARNHLVWCRDLARLPEAIAAARTRRFAPYEPPACRIGPVIAEYLLPV